MALDIIGDVHGHHDKLAALLAHMGYRCQGGAWRHPSRTAVFVGDLIDRGPHQLKTVELVRAMVSAGSARCILGNHEFNAIAWATADPDVPGQFLRRHSEHNRTQHRAFLRETEGTPRHDDIIAWFLTLPLWLDVGDLRIVHACWHQESIDVLRGVLDPDHTLTRQALVLGSRRGHPVFDAIEVVCKGPEVRLPANAAFADRDGKVRHLLRVRWWLPDVTSFRDAAIVPPGQSDQVPDLPLPAEWKGHRYTGPPVLFGHYWFTGRPEVISPHFACLDYSAARDGPLVAYRWDGEKALSSEKLAWV